MAFTLLKPLVMQAQKDLNCGKYCLEAIMRWKHGTPYGVDGVTPRTSHPQQAQQYLDSWKGFAGFDPGQYLALYGMKRIKKVPTSALEWENKLRKYNAPILIAGHIGTVSYIPIHKAGHFVVVVGVDASNNIEYMDPLNFQGSVGYLATISAQDMNSAIYSGQVYTVG